MSGKKVELTDSLGVDVDWLEAFAFAWLAKQAMQWDTGQSSFGNRRSRRETSRGDLS